MKKINLYNILLIFMITLLIINLVIYYSIKNPGDFKSVDLNVTTIENKAIYDVYYVYKNGIASEKKEIVPKNDIYYELISLYKKDQESFGSNKTKIYDIKIKSYRVYNNVLYIELLNNTFDSSKYTEETLPLYIQSFVNTVTQTNKNVQVQFLLDNKMINKTIKGVDFTEKFKWSDENIMLFDRDVYHHLEKFLGYIIDRNYELAYAMLPLKDRSQITYVDFVKIMNNYSNERNNRLPERKIITKVEDGYNVVITYDKNFDKKEEWHLIEKNNKTLLIEFNSTLIEQRDN